MFGDAIRDPVDGCFSIVPRGYVELSTCKTKYSTGTKWSLWDGRLSDDETKEVEEVVTRSFMEVPPRTPDGVPAGRHTQAMKEKRIVVDGEKIR